MQLQSMPSRRARDLFDPPQRPDFAAAAVVCVFDADQPGARKMRIRRAQSRLEAGAAEHAALTLQTAA
jgi:hypothetical protein